jgi:hypothetical protein
MVQVVECLPSKHKALISNPNTTPSPQYVLNLEKISELKAWFNLYGSFTWIALFCGISPPQPQEGVFKVK